MVSVCIPTYNGARFIREQIDSIINQLDSTDEIIISDDSSTDDTLDIVKSYHDSRIKIYSACFHSPTYNLENALYKASGDIIFLSDQDDIWLPNKVLTTKKILQEYDCVVSDAIVADENGEKLYDSFMELHGSKPGFFNNLKKNSYIGCCMAFNRKILKKCLPFPPKTPMHDYWIGVIAECFGKPIFIHDKLIIYRRHSKTVTHVTQKSPYSLYKRIYFRIIIILNILIRITKQ